MSETTGNTLMRASGPATEYYSRASAADGYVPARGRYGWPLAEILYRRLVTSLIVAALTEQELS